MISDKDKIYFIQRQDGDTVTVAISAQSSLGEVVSAFERFLRGAGFYFEGQLDFVNDEFDIKDDEDDWSVPESLKSAAWPFPDGSSDWETSINLDLQDMGAAGPTLIVSDDIDFSNINLDISPESSEPTVRFEDTNDHNNYYYDFDRHGRQDISSLSTEPHPIYAAEQIRELYSNGTPRFHSEK
jgi:hypothetical protein